MEVISLTFTHKPSAVKIAMGYRGVSQTKLCNAIEGLSQPNLSRFLKKGLCTVSEDKLRLIMAYLDFPFEFIYKDFPPIQSSNGWI